MSAFGGKSGKSFAGTSGFIMCTIAHLMYMRSLSCAWRVHDNCHLIQHDAANHLRRPERWSVRNARVDHIEPERQTSVWLDLTAIIPDPIEADDPDLRRGRRSGGLARLIRNQVLGCDLSSKNDQLLEIRYREMKECFLNEIDHRDALLEELEPIEDAETLKGPDRIESHRARVRRTSYDCCSAARILSGFESWVSVKTNPPVA